eukprot:9888095-Karenia_brevis.AAC.1
MSKESPDVISFGAATSAEHCLSCTPWTVAPKRRQCWRCLSHICKGCTDLHYDSCSAVQCP